MNKKYSIYINNEDYSKYLVLPFTINERIDESYNSAFLILDFIAVKDVFKPYTEVRIEV